MENYHQPKVGIVGFTNIGNTCYMSSILQLLIHCNPIILFLVERNGKAEYKNYIMQAGINRLAEKERKRLKLSEDSEIVIKRSELDELCSKTIIDKLSEIINTMIQKGNCEITPLHFKKIIDYKLPSFRGYNQHDAHELLLQILDNLIEETGIDAETSINNVPNIISEYIELLGKFKDRIKSTNNIEEKKIIIQELSRYKKNNYDIISKYESITYVIKEFKNRYNPFIYQIKTFLINNKTCTVCNNITSNYEVTTILELSVTDSISESLNKFISEEIINDYNCSICNCKTNVISKTKIFRLPIVLFIHLKRFINLSNSNFIKDNRNITIPFELDLNSYCDLSMNTDKNLSNIYKLKGISNHHGNRLNSGHYTADCAGIVDPDVWYNFNDSIVTKWNGNNIDTSSAYILMYEMII